MDRHINKDSMYLFVRIPDPSRELPVDVSESRIDMTCLEDDILQCGRQCLAVEPDKLLGSSAHAGEKELWQVRSGCWQQQEI